MELFKKFWKEISVFGLVAVVFLALYGYRKIVYVEYTTITASELTEKIKDKDDFNVVIGSSSDTTTTTYQETMQKYVEKNRGKKLYYCDLSTKKDYQSYIRKTFDTENGSLPQTFVISNGKVTDSKQGALSYYRLVQLCK